MNDAFHHAVVTDISHTSQVTDVFLRPVCLHVCDEKLKGPSVIFDTYATPLSSGTMVTTQDHPPPSHTVPTYLLYSCPLKPRPEPSRNQHGSR